MLQYIIAVLLQLNIESSNAKFNDAVNSAEHQLNRTRLRENLLSVLNDSIHPTSPHLIQQLAFALHLVTVSTQSIT